MKNKNSISVELLNTLSEKEIEQLEELASCRIFNSDKYVTLLIKVLKKRVWKRQNLDTNTKKLIYEQVFSETVNGPELNKKQRNLLSSKLSLLIRLIEQLFSIQKMRSNDLYKYNYLYPELINRKQYKLYEKSIKKDKEKISKIPHKTIEDYNQSLLIEESLFDYRYLKGTWEEDNLTDIVFYTDIKYLQKRLEHQLNKISLENICRDKNIKLPSYRHLDKLLNLPEYAEHPIIEIHLIVIHIMETEKLDQLDYLLELLGKHKDHFDRNGLAGMYRACTAACVIGISKGNLTYYKKLFEIYQIMHEANLIKEANFISTIMLKNIILIGCRVEEYDWALEMNAYYIPFIFKEIRESISNFNLGYIAFHQKQPELAHNYFLKVEKLDANFSIDTRILILQCLFEKEDNNNKHFMTALRSTESYIKKYAPLNANLNIAYSNFVKILRMLYKIRNGIGKTKIEDIKTELSDHGRYRNKKWLLEKIAELENISQGADVRL